MEPTALAARAHAAVLARRLVPVHRLPSTTAILLLGYLALVIALIVVRRAFPTPDVLLVFAAIAAAMLGRTIAFARDWVPLILIFLGWEAARNVAHQAGFPVHSDAVIAVERMLLFGTTAPEALQAALRTSHRVSTFDIATSVVYFAHFVLPLAVAFGFWLANRSTFVRYAVTLMGMSFVQFGFALLMPVAPPRYAGDYGEALAVVDVNALTAAVYAMEPVSWAYQNMIGNPVAAFPSLHAAYPVLAALFLWERHRTAAALMAAYAALVWFAIMYTGHHYLVDAIGGGALAVGAYCLSRLAERRLVSQRQ